jgi:conjugal transfer pilus assembly protein TraU
MKTTFKFLTVMFALLSMDIASAGQCVGKFAETVTELCWSCTFPMTIGGNLSASHDQEDTPNPPGFVCFCSNPYRVGAKFAFWEPVRRADVTRTPYCLVGLGGVSVDPGVHAPEGEVRLQEDNTKQSFWQVHWYIDPEMYIMEVLLDSPCIETGDFDVAYMTELDPTWNDDETTLLLNPESYLFGNPIAQAACAGDCVLATAGFPSNLLFWCAGCQGSIYPFNGRVQAHVSLIQASSLVLQRFTAKMHREFLMWGTTGEEGTCGNVVQPVMDKTQYKYQMLYPIAQTKKILGKCCQPFGRSTALWGAGMSYPYLGEDFVYEIFRKKNCCDGVGV